MPFLLWISRHALILFISYYTYKHRFGSYFYSIVAGYAPCKFCWYQRLFLFPQVIMFAIAGLISRKKKIEDNNVYWYSLVFSCIAFCLGAFQYYGSMFNPGILDACVAQGVSCSKNYFIFFGYITIPYMAVSTFALIIVVAFIRIRASSRS